MQRLVTVFADLRRDGFEVRIVPLAPREEQRRLIELLVGDKALLPEPESGEEAVQAPGEGSADRRACRGCSCSSASCSCLRSPTNERLLARLEVSR